MKVGTLLLILRDVVEGLEKMNLLLPDGSFTSPSIQQDLQIVTLVESSAKAHGIVVQSEVDKIIQTLPFVMAFIH